MSHFTVAVFHYEDQSIDEIMAPFQENNMGDCPKEYMEFEDCTDEIEETYNNHIVYEFNTSSYHSEGISVSDTFFDNILKSDFEHEFEMFVEYKVTESNMTIGKKYKIYPGIDTEKVLWIEVIDLLSGEIETNYNKTEKFIKDGKIKIKKIMSPSQKLLKEQYADVSYAEFVEDWFGYDYNEEEKVYGYWFNPNSKWDWFIIGGRWDGTLKLKNGTKVNSAKISDIDFEPTKEELEHAARSWDLKFGIIQPENEKDKEIIKWDFYKKEYYLEKYKTKENYVKFSTSFSTYAVINLDGEWIGKGDMGWFGFGSESPQEASKFESTFKENFIDNQDEDVYMTVIDCHI